MRILQGLLLSLGVHFLLVWGSQFLPSPSVSNRERIEFDVIEMPTSQRQGPDGQVVRQSLLPDGYEVTESEDPLSFLSEKNQRVRRQQRAIETGKTANRSPGKSGENSARENQNRQTSKKPRALAGAKPDLFSIDRDAVEIAASERAREEVSGVRSGNRLPQYLDLPQGFSTVGEALPNELEVGHFTALNTDRYLYYSFFVRIEDLIRYEWESQVKGTILRTPRGVFQAQSTDEYVSQIEVQLRSNGEFHKALLLKSSGIPGFDIAAIDSFAKAKIFPNPPRDMVEDDGLIRLKYSFTVRYQPRGMVTR